MSQVVSDAPQGTPSPDITPALVTILNHGDDNLILSQRLGEWISNAAELEIDIALGNIALDHLGVARALYTHAGELEGKGRTEDDFAMLRLEREFTNLLLVEQPNGDFAVSMVRQMLFDAYQLELWARMSSDQDEALAGIAARAMKEAEYHFRFSSSWVIRMGDGTDESHNRAQTALDRLWSFTSEMFEGANEKLETLWLRRVDAVLVEATLSHPSDPYQRTGGRRGFHTEHLGPLLAEMQWMQRSYPRMTW